MRFSAGMFLNFIPQQWRTEAGGQSEIASAAFQFAREIEHTIGNECGAFAYAYPLKSGFFYVGSAQSDRILGVFNEIDARIQKQKETLQQKEALQSAIARQTLQLQLQHRRSQRTGRNTPPSKKPQTPEADDKALATKTYQEMEALLHLLRLFSVMEIAEAFMQEGWALSHPDMLFYSIDLFKKVSHLVKDAHPIVCTLYPFAKQLFLLWLDTACAHLYTIAQALIPILEMRDLSYIESAIPLWELSIGIFNQFPHLFLNLHPQADGTSAYSSDELQVQLHNMSVRCASLQLEKGDGEAVFKLMIGRTYPLMIASQKRQDASYLHAFMQVSFSFIAYGLMVMLKQKPEHSDSEKALLCFWERGEITIHKDILTQTAMDVFENHYKRDGLLDMNGIRLRYCDEKQSLFEAFKNHFMAHVENENPKKMIASFHQFIKMNFAIQTENKRPLRRLMYPFDVSAESSWKDALQKEGLPIAGTDKAVVYTLPHFYEDVFYPYITLIETNGFSGTKDWKKYEQLIRHSILHIEELKTVTTQVQFDSEQTRQYFLEKIQNGLGLFQESLAQVSAMILSLEQKTQPKSKSQMKRAKKKEKRQIEQRRAQEMHPLGDEEVSSDDSSDDEIERTSAEKKGKTVINEESSNLSEYLANSKLSDTEVRQHLHHMMFRQAPKDVLAEIGETLLPNAKKAVQQIVGGQALLMNALPIAPKPVDTKINWVTPQILGKVTQAAQTEHMLSTVLDVMSQLALSTEPKVLAQHGVDSDALKAGLQWDLDFMQERHERTEHNQEDIEAALARRKEVLASSGRQRHPDGPSALTLATKKYRTESSLIGKTSDVLAGVGNALKETKKKKNRY